MDIVKFDAFSKNSPRVQSGRVAWTEPAKGSTDEQGRPLRGFLSLTGWFGSTEVELTVSAATYEQARERLAAHCGPQTLAVLPPAVQGFCVYEGTSASGWHRSLLAFSPFRLTADLVETQPQPARKGVSRPSKAIPIGETRILTASIPVPWAQKVPIVPSHSAEPESEELSVDDLLGV